MAGASLLARIVRTCDCRLDEEFCYEEDHGFGIVWRTPQQLIDLSLANYIAILGGYEVHDGILGTGSGFVERKKKTEIGRIGYRANKAPVVAGGHHGLLWLEDTTGCCGWRTPRAVVAGGHHGLVWLEDTTGWCGWRTPRAGVAGGHHGLVWLEDTTGWCGWRTPRAGVAGGHHGLVWLEDTTGWCGRRTPRAGVAGGHHGLVWLEDTTGWCGWRVDRFTYLAVS
ncbi:helicase SKI2W-like [Clarias magur]|uniref:Helicase SKI2W-like n=1 Tax=Clarias magur TaxID=1594786 RepID=A0A8J4TUN7_CLAMG|nr:helicase SKI2W-like [Clarias magur]